jgi:hypothetical protein
MPFKSRTRTPHALRCDGCKTILGKAQIKGLTGHLCKSCAAIHFSNARVAEERHQVREGECRKETFEALTQAAVAKALASRG